jgi:hypothetical protein
MQGNPEEYEKWLAERKSAKFSNFRLFAGAFSVWALLTMFFVLFGWIEAKEAEDLFFSCFAAALAVVWIKGQ